MKSIGIVGSDGYIGSYMADALGGKGYDVLKLSQFDDAAAIKFDLLDLDNFNYDILKNTDTLIYTAAISSPDLCENEYEKSYNINVVTTCSFIKKALDLGCKVIFFSSDAVYGQDQGGACTENTDKKPVSAYGRMKSIVEDKFITNDNFKAIRLSYILSLKDKFTQYLFKCFENESKATIYHPFYRNITTINDLQKAIELLISHWEHVPTSILNICGNELVSRIKIVDTYNRKLKRHIDYEIGYSKDFFNNRPSIMETNSIYLPNLIENYYESFENKVDNLFNGRIKE